MPDTSAVGTSLPPTAPYLVGREKIREFARAVGDDSPVCHDPGAARAAGYPDVVAPPTFTISFVLPAIEGLLHDPGFGWDNSRMVHAEQSVDLHRPVCAGDELVTTVHVEDLRTRAGSHRLTLRCEVAGLDGTAVATSRATLVTAAEAT